jgi:hypothetical protein
MRCAQMDAPRHESCMRCVAGHARERDTPTMPRAVYVTSATPMTTNVTACPIMLTPVLPAGSSLSIGIMRGCK